MAKAYYFYPGSVFAGYRVIERLGQGSMGSVYLVDDGGERRALKVMSADLSTDPKLVERFVLEARVSSAIASEHVTRVLASGVEESKKLPYYVMELLEGQDLGRRLEEGPAFSIEDTHLVLAQLFDAIGAAHDASIIHRDLKPANVFVATREGRPFVKVLDFGVAKIYREITLGMTAPGLGTPLWTAPEQAKKGAITPSADIWALGLITFRLLTGKMFWRTTHDPRASQYDVAFELLRGPIPKASERAQAIGGAALPEGFDAWFERTVARDREARYASGRAAWADLAPILAAPSVATPATPAPSAGERVTHPEVSLRFHQAFEIAFAPSPAERSSSMWGRVMRAFGGAEPTSEGARSALEITSLVAELYSALGKLGVHNAISLIVDEQVIFRDNAGKKDDLRDLVAALAARAPKIAAGFRRMTLAVEHDVGGLHAVIEVVGERDDRTGAAVLHVHTGARLRDLSPAPGETTDGYRKKLAPIVGDPVLVEADARAFTAFTERLQTTMQSAFPEGKVASATGADPHPRYFPNPFEWILV